MLGLLRAIGSPMFFTMATLDQPNTKIADAMHGVWDGGRMRPDSLDVLLLTGTNPVISKQYFGQNPGTQLKELVKRGTKLIVIDPRRTETARRAGDQHAIVDDPQNLDDTIRADAVDNRVAGVARARRTRRARRREPQMERADAGMARHRRRSRPRRWRSAGRPRPTRHRAR